MNFSIFYRVQKLLSNTSKKNVFASIKSCDIHENVHFSNDAILNIVGSPKVLKIGKSVSFRSYFQILMYPNSELLIMENTFFNNFCSINCLGKIEIGENTLFGEGVKLYDHNHKYDTSGSILKVERNDFTIDSIKIGKNCWIGSNVIILKNVEVGDNVIIGANCLIYKSIPANSIVKSSVNLDIKQFK